MKMSRTVDSCTTNRNISDDEAEGAREEHPAAIERPAAQLNLLDLLPYYL